MRANWQKMSAVMIRKMYNIKKIIFMKGFYMKKLLLIMVAFSALSMSPIYSMDTDNGGGAVQQLRHEPTATVEKLGAIAFGALSAGAVWVGCICLYRSVHAQMPWAGVGLLFLATGAYGLASVVLKTYKDHQN